MTEDTENIEQEIIPHTVMDERFCRVFVLTLSAAKAAKAIGIEGKNAKAIGMEKLRDPVITARIAELAEEQTKELDVQLNQIIFEYKSIAHSDLGEILNKGGGITKDIGGLPPHVRKAIKSLQIDETVDQETGKVTKRRYKVVLWDKLKALGDLGRTIDLFNERGSHPLLSASAPATEETDVFLIATRVNAIIEKGQKAKEIAEAKDKGEDLV